MKQTSAYPPLPKQRILSIDTLRGITILVMIFVNELAGMREIPAWMMHVPADADAMTFVDVVFPAFLFIVGMSIPFSIQNRLAKGDRFVQLQGHILFRTVGLLVLGVFMVNAEGNYNEAAMGMSIHLWSLGFFMAAILVWNVYTFQHTSYSLICRGVGIAGLVALALIYRGGDGTEYMRPQWWGILGLIGWAYLFTTVLYQVTQGKLPGLLLMVGFCTGVYVVGHSEWAALRSVAWTGWASGHAAHASVALCGVIVALIFFDQQKARSVRRRFLEAGMFTAALFLAGFLLRPYFKISKIYATPTWCFYSAACCCLLFAFLYWLIDLRKINRWTAFFQPAAANPLLVYIIPYILSALFLYFDFYPVPASIRVGLTGILWSALFAIAIMWLAKLLNRLRIRLQL